MTYHIKAKRAASNYESQPTMAASMYDGMDDQADASSIAASFPMPSAGDWRGRAGGTSREGWHTGRSAPTRTRMYR